MEVTTDDLGEFKLGIFMPNYALRRVEFESKIAWNIGSLDTRFSKIWISEILKIFIYMIDFVLPPLYHSGNLEGIQIELKVINELMKKHNKRLIHK